jgi:citrate lyase subunit beta/citryl-CoA lyase
MKNDNKIAKAGNSGPKVRSDCQVTIELKSSGGLKIDLNSKVKAIYEKSIINLIKNVFNSFGLKNAVINMNDSGALDFVLSARLEAAIKQLINTDEEFLPEMISENYYSSKKEQFRFSRLYLPGNTPSMMINAGVHNPNGIILDLEDSVSFNKKDEAKFLVRNALRQVNFYGAERMVRINQLPAGLLDLKYIVPHNINMILIPKCESANQIKLLEEEVNILKKKFDIKYPIWYMPIIESAIGVEKSYEIATSSKNIAAMAIGLEDFTADLGVQRTIEGTESLYARTRIVNACVAAGIQPIDSVFSDVGDEEGLRSNVNNSKSLGFTGMGCIHPRQIKIIHESFAPGEKEINKAKLVVDAFCKAEQKGLGVVSLGIKMIDPPVVKRAERTIDLATRLGLLDKNWRDNYEG